MKKQTKSNKTFDITVENVKMNFDELFEKIANMDIENKIKIEAELSYYLKKYKSILVCGTIQGDIDRNLNVRRRHYNPQ
jgi:hypothetical protein